MIKINFVIDEYANFLMVLYQKLKRQNDFKNIKIEKSELSNEDKKSIKNILRTEKDFLEGIKKYPKIKEIYEINKDSWHSYFEENVGYLKKIVSVFKEKIGQYDFNIFEKVEKFFEAKGPREINVWVCLGNESESGTGNAFTPNICVIFPREFNNFKEENINLDFAVLIHEVMHLYQNMCKEEDKELMERVARCFAPRGILINESKMKREGESLQFYGKIKEGFYSGKRYKELFSKDLNKQDSLEI